MKWTKKDIKIMCGTLSTFWLLHRPLDGSTSVASTLLLTFLDAPQRLEVVCAGIEDLVDMNWHRAVEAEKTSNHYADHPNVMGKETPEIVRRFANIASEYERDGVKGKDLLEKIKSNGLPPEVLMFDPTGGRVS